MSLPDSEFFKQLAANPSKVLAAMCKDLEELEHQRDEAEDLRMHSEIPGIVKERERFDMVIRHHKKITEINERMIYTMMVYLSGNHFPVDAFTAAAKAERLEENRGIDD